MEIIIVMIIEIAISYGLPPNFVLAIALVENPQLDPMAIHLNVNGTVDRGIMQLNSSWYDGNWECPETNIRAGCELILWIMEQDGVNTWWGVAIVYNAGYSRLLNPPETTIDYANRVTEDISIL